MYERQLVFIIFLLNYPPAFQHLETCAKRDDKKKVKWGEHCPQEFILLAHKTCIEEDNNLRGNST